MPDIVSLNTTQPTVIVADGLELFRDAISGRLQTTCNAQVLAKPADGYSTIKACRQYAPDVLFLDLAIERPNGIEVLERVCSLDQSIKVIVLSSEATFHSALLTLNHGAIGFLPKQASGEDFANAMSAAINNFAYWPIEYIRSIAKARGKITRSGNIFGLSMREIEVLEASLDGQTAKEVAHNFQISVRTVQTHKHSIYKKTNCRDKKGLSVIAAAL